MPNLFDIHTVPGPEPKDDDVKVLKLVALHQPEPFVQAKWIESDMEVGEKRTRQRLDELAEEGYLRRRKVGSVNLYWLSDDGRELLASSES
jgi:Mn-dependent DtxR family transcriptional regulator